MKRPFKIELFAGSERIRSGVCQTDSLSQAFKAADLLLEGHKNATHCLVTYPNGDTYRILRRDFLHPR